MKLTAELFQVVLQLHVGVEESRTHGSLTDPQNLADVGMLQALDVVKGYHSSVVFRQLHHGLVQSFLKFVNIYVLQGVPSGGQLDEVRVVLDAAVHVVQAELGMTIALLEEVERHIDTNR